MAVAQRIREEIARVFGVPQEEVKLEHPADLKNGDYSTGVEMQFAKRLGKNPLALADIFVNTGPIDGVEKIEIAGPGFINFYLAANTIADSIKTAQSEDMWGANENLKSKKIMVEYTDPNPFKEFHIGHLMSNAIGESIARLSQFSGAEVKRANYQGDVGPHVAKAIWALAMKKPSLLEISMAYANGAKAYEENPQAKAEIDAVNQKIYDKSDPEINESYTYGRNISLQHFEILYRILGTKFDYYFFESETGPRGVEIVRTHPEVFTISEGATVFQGEKAGLHTRVFLTSKGLPTYETKELGLAEMKEEKWSADVLISVTAHEQADYFKVVLAAMKEVMPEIATKIRHISHGMMRLPTGKMSSRTGDVITGESLLKDLIVAAEERAKDSRATSHHELAEQVAVAAIKYQILKQASGKDIIFDRERALSLEGDSGPYLQYAHARACAVVEKAREQHIEAKAESVEPSELARLIHRFPEAVEYAASELEPHLLSNYLLALASAFNSWYAQVHILDGSTDAHHKVALTAAVARTLKNGLWVLGISTPEKM